MLSCGIIKQKFVKEIIMVEFPKISGQQEPYSVASQEAKGKEKTAKIASTDEMTPEEIEQVSKEFDKVMENWIANSENKDVPRYKNVRDLVLEILSEMAKKNQGFAISQANYSTILTGMSKMYTEMINQIPLYDDTNKKPPGWDDKWDAPTKSSKLGDANAQQNKMIEDLKNLRSIVDDENKKNQTSMNTSVDSQKNLLDIIQNFLQQWREWDSLMRGR